MREIGGVFGAYGISVDWRHLSLVADFMTRNGAYQAFNRRSMVGAPSSLQQMSFETTMGFMQKAVLQGSVDTLSGPSARLVLGRLTGVGSALCDVLTDLSFSSR